MHRGTRPIAIRLLVVVLAGALVALAAATFAFGFDFDSDPAQSAAHAAAASGAVCGAAAAETTAAIQAHVASSVYADELRGSETRADLARVTGYAPLLQALAHNDAVAVRSAVHALVYMPHWHIVRLRVTQGTRVIADVGGPHILAPVRGTLRVHGRRAASFVMSVQDDLGFVKLVTRFIGAPVDLYRSGTFVVGTMPGVPAAAPGGAHVRAGGRGYLASPLSLHAFPSGPLEAVLFVPETSSGLSCAALRVADWGAIARLIAARFHPFAAHYQDFANLFRAVTDGRVLVRAGATRLVGAGPRHLRSSGAVRYDGRRFEVYSWQPLAGVRVYALTPAG